MDIATILGLVGGVLVVLKMAGEPATLYQGTTLLLVIAGGLAALLVSCPLREALNLFSIVKRALFPYRVLSPSALIERVVGFAETARRQGILALEAALDKKDDPFLQAGTRLAVDGTEPALIMDIMETERRFIEKRHQRNGDLMDRLGRYWALFGAIGALLVLVAGDAAGDALVAQAALPLFYGALLYALVGGPLARKLQSHSQSEMLRKLMIIEAVMAIQSGDNPRIVEHKLSVFIPPKDRPSSPPPAAAPPQPPAEDHTRDDMQAFLSDKRDLILRLVREAVQKSAAAAEQKAQVEAAVDQVERGELSLVALMVLLGADVRDGIFDRLNNPPPPLVAPTPAQNLDFEDLTALTDQAIQTLLREVDQKDLVCGLKGASSALQDKILGNISGRVRTFIEEEMGFARPRPEQIFDAQVRIVMQLLQLREQGRIKLD